MAAVETNYQTETALAGMEGHGHAFKAIQNESKRDCLAFTREIQLILQKINLENLH